MAMNRRNFIAAATASGTLALVPHAYVSAAPSSESSRRLVIVFLRGGADGLNIVVPYTEADYYRRRPTIAIPAPGQSGGAIDLDDRFGLNPALSSLMPFWDRRQLAFVHAAGSHDPSRSHFDAQNNMESGTPGHHRTVDGWLNRLSGALPSDTALRDLPTRVVTVGSSLPRIAYGRNPVTTIPFGKAAARPGALDTPAVRARFNKLYADDPALGPLLKAYADARDGVRNSMQNAHAAAKEADRGAPSYFTFGGDAVRLGTLMRRDPRVKIGFLPVSGWDTHSQQDSPYIGLNPGLSRLGRGLNSLVQALGPVFEDTTIVVISEFGRSVAENGSSGTDHGHGNVIWLLGGGVAGGKVHGAWPGLDEAQLYERRDLAVTTDFRSVLGHICERHMLLPENRLSVVFPGFPYKQTPIALFRA